MADIADLTQDEPATASVADTIVDASAAPADTPAGTKSALFRALDFGGLFRTELLAWLALALTGAFVLLEIRYNIDLFNTLIDPASSRETIQALSDRGKLLAAVGISWACGRFLLERVRPALLGLALLVGLAAGVYLGLDTLYTTVIRDLPPAVKLKGFSLFGYRQDLLTGKLFDPDIPLPKDEPVQGRIIMGAFPIILIDDRFMLPASDIVERKANDKIRFVLKDAQAAWPDYSKQMQELRDGHRDFIKGSKEALPYGAEGIKEFKKKSGGFSPDASLTLPQFVDMLRQSKHPKGQDLRDAEARQIAKRPDGTPVLAAEVPKFLDRPGYLGWFEAQAKKARDDALPTVSTVERMEGIQDMNSAIFLPPMAMMASLTSALTNGLTFVLLAFTLLGRRWGPAPVRRIAATVSRFGAPIMLLLFALLLLAAPAYVFAPGPLRNLEQKMHNTLGLAGHAWSRLSSVQSLVLRGQP